MVTLLVKATALTMFTLRHGFKEILIVVKTLDRGAIKKNVEVIELNKFLKIICWLGKI